MYEIVFTVKVMNKSDVVWIKLRIYGKSNKYRFEKYINDM